MLNQIFNQLNTIETPLIQCIQSFQGQTLTTAMNIFTFLGNPFFWIIIAGIYYWLGKERRAFYMMNLIILAAVSIGSLKRIFGRTRPSLLKPTYFFQDTYTNLSFPSGHTTLVAAMLSFLENKWKQKWILVFLALILVAISRVYLGMHYISDVIAGIILGYILGKINLWLAEKIEHSDFKLKRFKISMSKEKILIIILTTIFLGTLILFNDYPELGTLIGFYLGFFTYKELSLEQTKIELGQMMLKQTIGLSMTILLAITTLYFQTEIYKYAAFFVIGLWISFLWPWAYQKSIKTKNCKKSL